jgi:hypothetical protein
MLYENHSLVMTARYSILQVGIMSSTIAHAVTASFIAMTCAHVTPHETGYIAAALVSATVLDLDHLPFIIKDWKFYRQNGFRGNLHQARSIFHEMFGLLAAGILAALLFRVDQKLASVVFIALCVHLAQDWLLGRFQPFKPVDNTLVHLFKLTFRQKMVIEVLTVILFGGLWIAYLSAGL